MTESSDETEVLIGVEHFFFVTGVERRPLVGFSQCPPRVLGEHSAVDRGKSEPGSHIRQVPPSTRVNGKVLALFQVSTPLLVGEM